VNRAEASRVSREMEHFYAHPGVYRSPKGGDSPRSRGAYRKDLWRWVKYYDQAEVEGHP